MKSKSFANYDFQNDDVIQNYNEIIKNPPKYSKTVYFPQSSYEENPKKKEEKQVKTLIPPKVSFPFLDEQEEDEKELFIQSKKVAYLKKRVEEMQNENDKLRNEVEMLEEEANSSIINQKKGLINNERTLRALQRKRAFTVDEMNDIKARKVRLEDELLQIEKRKKELQKEQLDLSYHDMNMKYSNVQGIVDSLGTDITKILKVFEEREKRNKERKKKEKQQHKEFMNEMSAKIEANEKRIQELSEQISKQKMQNYKEQRIALETEAEGLDREIQFNRQELRKSEIDGNTSREIVKNQQKTYKQDQDRLTEENNGLDMQLIDIKSEIDKQKTEETHLSLQLDSLSSQENLLLLREKSAEKFLNIYRTNIAASQTNSILLHSSRGTPVKN